MKNNKRLGNAGTVVVLHFFQMLILCNSDANAIAYLYVNGSTARHINVAFRRFINFFRRKSNRINNAVQVVVKKTEPRLAEQPS